MTKLHVPANCVYQPDPQHPNRILTLKCLGSNSLTSLVEEMKAIPPKQTYLKGKSEKKKRSRVEIDRLELKARDMGQCEAEKVASQNSTRSSASARKF